MVDEGELLLIGGVEIEVEGCVVIERKKVRNQGLILYRRVNQFFGW